ncbi:MerR family transcriptional regulator [Streptomyces sp. WMMB 322]|uniref:MerR family transcriptional regulator n=1 Tax=Streptomyces sp. WMMB 322 TaxID=1286821 RepID=UPI0008238848|nr:MerR family transcriptional regulator [Streptomyces sp. WMMB 322]SCK14203.1 MerR HTH family regulatory protein [Streptomyces sp. WMMB 322]
MTVGRDGLAGRSTGGRYRIEDLAGHSGATVRTIRAYQDRGLLPRPGRRGRANVYDDTHLTRLRQISALLERGYTLASIKELLEAWDEGRGLSGVLGLVSEVEGPWTDEEPERMTRSELDELFGGGSGDTDGAVAEAVELGVLVPLPERPGEYLLPSPQELAVAAELHRAGVPLLALTEHLRELRTQVEGIAARFMELTDEHIFRRCLHPNPSDEDASETAGLVRRLRPLAKQTVDAELARAMRTFASRSLREHLRRAADGVEDAGSGGVEWDGYGREDVRPDGAGPGTSAGEAPGTSAGEAPGTQATLPEPAGTEAPATHASAPHATAPVMRGAEATLPEPADTKTPGTKTPGTETPGTETPGTETAETRTPGTEAPAGEPVRLPAATLAAVRKLVGAEQAAAFIAAAAEREVRARAMDRLAGIGETPAGRTPGSR